jgi:hypothetical protein
MYSDALLLVLVLLLVVMSINVILKSTTRSNRAH